MSDTGEDLKAKIREQVKATLTEQVRSKLTEMLDLTPTQQRRALATVSGKSLSKIAAEEGTSKQAIAKTVASPKVRDAVRDLIGDAYVLERVNGVEEKTPYIDAALMTLHNLLGAKKAVVFGSSFEMVPDNQTRLAAAVKILALYEPEPPPPAAPAPPTVEESTVVEETATATRRVARRRRMVG